MPDFKFEMLEMKRKYAILRKQFNENKLEIKIKSTELTLEHNLRLNKECSDSPFIGLV